MKKRLLSLVLVFVMLLGMIPGAAFATAEEATDESSSVTESGSSSAGSAGSESAGGSSGSTETPVAPTVVQSGQIGESITWSLMSSGMLNVFSRTGSAVMPDFSESEPAPWAEYADQVTNAFIAGGVISIGSGAFRGLTALTNVNIAGSLNAIGDEAFAGCTALTSVSFQSDAPISISDGAFTGVTATCWYYADKSGWTAEILTGHGGNLTWTAYPSGGESETPGGSGGGDSDSPETPVAPTVVQSGQIGDSLRWSLMSSGMLNVFNTTDDAVMPDFSESAPAPWAAYADQVLNAFIAAGVTNIGSGAFRGLSSLTNVNIAGSPSAIGDEAFAGCTALATVNFQSDAPSSISESAFTGVTATCWYYADKNGWTAEILTGHGGSLTWTAYPTGGTDTPEPPGGDDSSNPCGKDVRWSLDAETGTLTITGSGAMWDSMSLWDAYAEDILHVVISEGVTRIGSSAFSGLDKLTDVSIASSVTTIGNGAFYYCQALESVRFTGSGITAIEPEAFYNCDSLESIALPPSLSSIGESAFAFCDTLETVSLANGLVSIGACAFQDCAALRALSVPASVTSVGEDAFIDCTALETVSFAAGEGAVSLETWAFARCSSLATVTFSGNVASIGNNAFFGCGSLSEVRFAGAAPEIIDILAFNGVSAVCRYNAGVSWTEDVMLDYGGRLLWVPSSAGPCGFYGEYLTWALNGGVLEISGMGAMETAEAGMPWSGYIGEITDVVIGDDVREICSGAFAGHSALERVTVGSSVGYIRGNAFVNCPKLASVTFTGPAPTIDDSAFSSVTATCYYPADAPSWVSGVRVNYGGTLSWMPVGGETPGFEGKTLSILGDSISTYTGISDNADYNSTLAGGAIYYTAGRHGVYQPDTWWQQTIDRLGLALLVNNSWSGSCIMNTRSGTVGAYIDRAVQLHNDNQTDPIDPDIIAIYLGTNDFGNYKSTLGTAGAIDYDTLITAAENGGYTYSVPETAMEAYAVMLHKTAVRYPDAEIYCFTLLPQTGLSTEHIALMQTFNAGIRSIASYFGAEVVDLYADSGIKADAYFGTYVADNSLHPGPAGMDAITNCFVSALQSRSRHSTVKEDLVSVSYDLSGAAILEGTVKTAVKGETLSLTVAERSGYTLDVSVSMAGVDITADCYADGAITVENVSGDIVITATMTEIPPEPETPIENTPANFRWEYDAASGALVNVTTNGNSANALTMTHGSIAADGTLSGARYTLGENVVLNHNLPWSIEWKSSGSWTDNTDGALLFAEAADSATSGGRYFYRRHNSQFFALGEYDGNYHNYAADLSGIDASAEHVWRLVNQLNDDGSNMVVLYMDGSLVGELVQYYVGGTDKNAESGWVSGKNFSFGYMGTNPHTIGGCKIEYIQVREAGIAASGTCGSKLNWTLDEAGTLTVSGSGTMNSFTYASRVPWHSYRDAICRVVVREGVTNIEQYAFQNCTNLTEIVLPKSLASLRYAAFKGCTSLTEVTIPAGITHYGSSTFADCTALTNVVFTPGAALTGGNMFENCTALKTVSLPGSMKTIGSWAFSGCSSLTDLVIPSGVTTIENGAFSGCSSLTEIALPNTLTTLGGSAFRRCTGLTHISIPNSLTILNEGAFGGCTGLTDVTIPSSITSLSGFSGCTGLTEITIPASVKTIGKSAFSGCTGLAEITIPDGVTSIGENAFTGCTGLTEITIPANVTTIGEHAFENCTGFTKCSILGKVSTIDKYAFASCTNLASINLPEGLTTIGNYAFYSCSKLDGIVLPSSLSLLGGYAFAYCTSLSEITIPAGISTLGDHAFYGCTGLTKAVLADGVSKLSTNFFASCSKLSEVVLPASVTEIGSSAFGNCTALASIDLPEKLVTLGASAFGNCTALTSIDLPDSLTTIGSAVFSNCTALTGPVIIPDGVSAIGSRLFSGCSKLQSVVLSKNTAVIDQYAFEKCTALASITIPASVKTINRYAFSACSALREIIFEGDAPTFADNTVLINVKNATCWYGAGNGTWTADKLLSYGASNLTWKPRCAAGYVDENNDGICDVCGCSTAVILASGVTGDLKWTVDSNYVLRFYGKGAMGSHYTYAPWRNYRANLTAVVIPEGVTAITEYVFDNTPGLTEIDIPSTVTSIGNGAFRDCSNLTGIALPEGLTSLGTSVFEDCAAITEVVIPVGVTSLGAKAFKGCTSLSKVVFQDKAVSIANDAFTDVTADCYYPVSEASWTAEVRGNYGGTLTWKDAGELNPIVNVAAIGDAVYPSVQEAVDAAESGETVTLLTSVTVTSPVTVAADDKLTLDLAGYVLKTEYTENDGIATHTLVNLGDLTIVDSGAVKGGIVAGDCDIAADGAKTANGYAVHNLGTLLIRGAKIISTNWDYAVFSEGDTTVEPGSVIEGSSCLYQADATLTVSGGSFTVTVNTANARESVICLSDAVAYIRGGSFDGTLKTLGSDGAGSSALMLTGSSTAYVYDGSFRASEADLFCRDAGSAAYVYGGSFSTVNPLGSPLREQNSNTLVEVSGGTYVYDPSDYVAENYRAIANGNGTWTVKYPVTVTVRDVEIFEGEDLPQNFLWDSTDRPEGSSLSVSVDRPVVSGVGTYPITARAYGSSGLHVEVIPGTLTVKKAVAKIGGTKYETLEAAAEAAASNDTITLLTDVTLESTASFYRGVTLDLDGHSITAAEDFGGDWLIGFSGDAFTVRGGTVGNPDDIAGNAGISLALESGTLTLESGSFNSICTSVYVMRGELRILGGEYRSLEVPPLLLDCEDDAFRAGYASVQVSGGTFHGFDPANSVADALEEPVSLLRSGYQSVANDDDSWSVWPVIEVKVDDKFIFAGDDLPDFTYRTENAGDFELSVVFSVPEITGPGEYPITAAVTVKSESTVLVNVTPGTLRVASPAATIGERRYATLQEAFDHAAGGDTVLLADDLTLSAPAVNRAAVAFTLDLNGHNITAAPEIGAQHFCAISNYGTLTLTDSRKTGVITARGIENFGTLTVNDGVTVVACDANGGSALWNEGTLTVSGGRFMTAHLDADGSAGGPSALYNSGTAALNDGIFTSDSLHAYAVRNGGGTLTVNLADISGARVIAAEGGSIELLGGSFYPTESAETAGGHLLYAAGGFLTVRGGTYGASGVNASLAGTSGGSISATGGSFFYDPSGIAAPRYIAVQDADGLWNVSPLVKVSMDSFSIKVGDELPEFTYQTIAPEGLALTVNVIAPEVTGAGTYPITAEVDVPERGDAVIEITEGTLTVVEPVAKIGEIRYATLQEAIDAAAEGETVELIADVTADSSLYIAPEKTLTLDLAGHTLLGTADTGSVIDNHGKLTLTDSRFEDGDGSLTAGGLNARAVYSCGTLQAENIRISGTGTLHPVRVEVSEARFTNAHISGAGAISASDAEVTVVSGSYRVGVNSGRNMDSVLEAAASGITVLGGSFDGSEAAITSVAVHADLSSTVTVEGGEFRAKDYALYSVSSEILVFGGTFYQPLALGNSLASIVVRGGSFTADPAAFVPFGYRSAKQENGFWQVQVVEELQYKPADRADGRIVSLRHHTTVEVAASSPDKIRSIEILLGEEVLASLAGGENDYTLKLSYEWDLQSLSGEKTLTYRVTDGAGKVREASATVNVLPYTAAVAPVVTAEGHFKSGLLTWTYDNAEALKTIRQFKVYSCDAEGSNLTLLTNLTNLGYNVRNLTNEEHYFMVAAEDIYGAVAYSEVVTLRPILTEDVPPTANIQVKAVLPAVNMPVTFSASGSADNDGIASYEWNFGDGSTGSGAVFSHSYGRAGTYTVTLTVTDHSGNEGTASATVTVVDPEAVDSQHSLLTVTVIDGYREGTPAIPNATVTVYDEKNFEVTVVTDHRGQATLVVPRGECTVAAAADGFVASARKVTPNAGTSTCSVPLAAVGVETVGGSLTVTPMTYEEMVEAGIDVTDPANNHVVKTEFTLEFQVLPGLAFEIPVSNITNERGEPADDDDDDEPNWIIIDPEPIPDDDDGGSGTVGPIYPDIPPMKVAVVPLTDKFYLVIYGETHWLKEMFNVKLLVVNNSYTETIEDCEATLVLPEGLSLADMVGTAQTLTQTIGDIGRADAPNDGNMASTTWYVRGDEMGEYSLTAVVTGDMVSASGVRTPFLKNFTTTETVKVYAGSALKLSITAQDTAFYNTEYFVQFKLENVTTDRTLYNLSFGLTGAEQFRAELLSNWEEGEKEQLTEEDFAGGMTHTIPALAPGDSITINFVTKTLFLDRGLEFFADIFSFAEIEYLLKDVLVTTLEGSTTEIPYEVTILPVERQSFTEWLMGAAKDKAEEELVDAAVTTVDAALFGGIPVTSTVVKVFSYGAELYEQATNTPDSYATISVENGVYFTTPEQAQQMASTYSLRRSRASEGGVAVYTDGEYEIDEDGNMRLYSGKLYVLRTGETVDENGNEIEPMIHLTTNYVDGSGKVQTFTQTLMEAKGAQYTPSDLMTAEDVHLGEPVGEDLTVSESADGTKSFSLELPLLGERTVTFPFAALSESGELVGKAANLEWEITDPSGSTEPAGLYLSNGVLTVDSAAKPGEYTLTLTAGEKSESRSFTLLPNPISVESLRILRGGIVRTGDLLGAEEGSYVYTVLATDQNGNEFETNAAWTLEGNVDGVTLIDNILVIESGAASGVLTLTAELAGKRASIPVTVIDPADIEVESVVYDETTASAEIVNESGSDAAVQGMLVAYDANGRMIGIGTASGNLAAGGRFSLALTVQGSGTIDELRIFVLSAETGEPLTLAWSSKEEH